MSANVWLLWFTAQALVLLAVLGVAMLGVTGHLSRTRRAASRPQHRHHFLHFQHHPAR